MKAFVDADVLIWHLRGSKPALDFLRRVAMEHAGDLWLGAMQRAEIVFFMRADEEAATNLLLSKFKTSAVNAEVVDHAAALYRRWRGSHGVDINDMMLAAAVIKTGGILYTLNTKHYPMPECPVRKAW